MPNERPCVLVVEDDDAVREFCRSLLTANGYEVLEARNGAEGLQVYRQRPCEVIVLDLYMPKKEGLETIRELRAVGRPVKILAISGGWHQDASDMLEVARSLGADDALKKPFPGLALVKAVERLRRPQGTT